MTVAINDVVRCVAKQQDVNGSIIQNVYFFENDGLASVTNPDFLTAVEIFLSAVYAEMEDWIPNSCDPTSIVCDKVEFSSGILTSIAPIGEIAWTTWAGGTSATEGLPQGNAALFTLPSPYTPGVQGRKYIGPLVESAQNNGILLSTVQTALAAFAAELLDGFLVGAVDMVPRIMSSKMGDAIPMATAIVKAIVAYQRRRKSGVGV